MTEVSKNRPDPWFEPKNKPQSSGAAAAKASAIPAADSKTVVLRQGIIDLSRFLDEAKKAPKKEVSINKPAIDSSREQLVDFIKSLRDAIKKYFEILGYKNIQLTQITNASSTSSNFAVIIELFKLIKESRTIILKNPTDPDTIAANKFLEKVSRAISSNRGESTTINSLSIESIADSIITSLYQLKEDRIKHDVNEIAKLHKEVNKIFSDEGVDVFSQGAECPYRSLGNLAYEINPKQLGKRVTGDQAKKIIPKISKLANEFATRYKFKDTIDPNNGSAEALSQFIYSLAERFHEWRRTIEINDHGKNLFLYQSCLDEGQAYFHNLNYAESLSEVGEISFVNQFGKGFAQAIKDFIGEENYNNLLDEICNADDTFDLDWHANRGADPKRSLASIAKIALKLSSNIADGEYNFSIDAIKKLGTILKKLFKNAGIKTFPALNLLEDVSRHPPEARAKLTNAIETVASILCLIAYRPNDTDLGFGLDDDTFNAA